MRKAAAKVKLAEEEAEKTERAKVMNPAEDFVELCLPCEDKAYGDGLDFRLCSADRRLADERVRKAASQTIPLRNDTISVNSHGSTRSWLASADEGSQSGAIKHDDPSGAQTIPKPDLISEIRGPKGITAAAMQIFSRPTISAQPQPTYPAEMVHRACRNFEQFHELSEGEATEE